MAVTIETLEKLERRITLMLPLAGVVSEVQSRLKRLSRTVKADGFRPGKMPMSMVAQRYGHSVHYEVINDQIGKAFSSATQDANLRVAGSPKIVEKTPQPEGHIAFDATFEVFPEIVWGDLETLTITRVNAEVSQAAVDKTIDILRKQKRSFSAAESGQAAQIGHQVTVDFEGKIDAVAFEGGKATDFVFVIGEGQMLEAFEKALPGMKVGDSKTFPLIFPENYQSKDVAGKEADFLITLKKIEIQHLPEINDALAQDLGIEDGTLAGLRADIQRNLEREVKHRVLVRNKTAVMDALIQITQLDLPTTLVQQEAEHLAKQAIDNMKERGLFKDTGADTSLPTQLFEERAQRRVRLGLIMSELTRLHNLQAKPEQVLAHIQELSKSYESPSDVVAWYLSDRERMAEVDALVVENNATEFVLSKAKLTDQFLTFDELMAR